MPDRVTDRDVDTLRELDFATRNHLDVIPEREGWVMPMDCGVRASSLVVAWNSYVLLFGEPPHGTEKQMRALLRLVPALSTTGEPKP